MLPQIPNKPGHWIGYVWRLLNLCAVTDVCATRQVVSTSADGITFDRAAVVAWDAPPVRYPGGAKGPGFQYPSGQQFYCNVYLITLYSRTHSSAFLLQCLLQCLHSHAVSLWVPRSRTPSDLRSNVYLFHCTTLQATFAIAEIMKFNLHKTSQHLQIESYCKTLLLCVARATTDCKAENGDSFEIWMQAPCVNHHRAEFVLICCRGLGPGP